MTRKNPWPTALVCVALALGILALYAPAFHFDFVNYDDQIYVTGNPHVNTGFHWSELGWFFSDGYAGNWHPLTWISHAIDCQIFGLHAGGHHAVNILLHVANSILVFLLLRSMTGAFWRPAMVAAFFAWHPLHVESVAWIAERKDVLSAFFFLLAIFAYVRYVRGSRLCYGLALALFALGLMSKPMVVTLPCVLLLLDFWPLRRFVAGENSFDERRLAPILVEKVPFLLLSIASSIITVVAQDREGVLAQLSGLSWRARLVNGEMTYWNYLRRSFWPADLGPTYPYVFTAPILSLFVIGVILIGVTILAARSWKARPYWLTGWFWFVGMLIPVIDIFHAGGQPMADRYMYLPSIGLLIVICWEASDLASQWQGSRAILGGAAAVALLACLAVSSRQLQFWRDAGTIVARIPQPASNFAAHANYAAYLMHQQQLPKAEEECRAAIAIAPNNPAFFALLGEIQRQQGKLEEATRTLRSVLAHEPGLVAVHLPLGEILLQEGRASAAATEFGIVVQAVPNDPEAHWWRGNALLAAQDTTNALREFFIALKLRPNYPNALNDAAWTLATDPRPQFHDPAAAVKLAESACRLSRGTQPQMLGTLAAAYAAAGRFDDAVTAAQKAHDAAVSAGQTNLARQNLNLQQLYRAHRPYTEKP